MDIEDWRSEIDAIDMELLGLLNIRARLAIAVGALKRTACLPLCDLQREAKVLEHVRGANSGPLDDETVAKLFRHIINASRHAERSSYEEVSSAPGEIAL